MNALNVWPYLVSSRQLWGQSLPSLEFNVTGFDRYEFKFRPKRSDFGRKKLRTAETAVGFRLSEVVLSPGRRGGKLGGLQQALRRTPVFYPYRADSQSGPFGRGVCHGRATYTIPKKSRYIFIYTYTGKNVM